MQITTKQLVAMGATSTNAEKYLDGINEALEVYNINTPARVSQFIANIYSESGALSNILENLNYSADALMKYWPARYPTLTVANQYARKPQLIANKNMGGRFGNDAINDGWKFRGRGLKQISFKSNYTRCGNSMGVDLINNPDILLDPRYAALSAGWFWHEGSGTDLNILADKNNSQSFRELCIKINGGTIGLETRQNYWEKAKKIFV